MRILLFSLFLFPLLCPAQWLQKLLDPAILSEKGIQKVFIDEFDFPEAHSGNKIMVSKPVATYEIQLNERGQVLSLIYNQDDVRNDFANATRKASFCTYGEDLQLENQMDSVYLGGDTVRLWSQDFSFSPNGQLLMRQVYRQPLNQRGSSVAKRFQKWELMEASRFFHDENEQLMAEIHSVQGGELTKYYYLTPDEFPLQGEDLNESGVRKVMYLIDDQRNIVKRQVVSDDLFDDFNPDVYDFSWTYDEKGRVKELMVLENENPYCDIQIRRLPGHHLEMDIRGLKDLPDQEFVESMFKWLPEQGFKGEMVDQINVYQKDLLFRRIVLGYQ